MSAPLSFLKSVNDFLEQVPLGALAFFQKIFKEGEEYTQEFVDACCIWIAWKINLNVERMRQKVIKQLTKHYEGALKTAQSMNVFVKAVTDPLGTIGAVFNYFAKPISIVKEFYEVLVVEIPRLAENLANIANSLPPAPPNPRINFNAFKLKIGTITLAELTDKPMPTPEEMFPEPPSPFSKEAFNKSFENAPAKTAEDRILYKMSEENTDPIMAALEQELGSYDVLNKNSIMDV